jgi:hypothetical protein
MKLRNHWIIREDQWGTDIILIKNESEVYNVYEDRSGGSNAEIYLGSLQEFVLKNINSNSAPHKEAALYIQENYLKN